MSLSEDLSERQKFCVPLKALEWDPVHAFAFYFLESP